MQLLRIALENPVRLLNDEYSIIKTIGIHCSSPALEQISWFEKTGRVSSTWRINVCDKLSIAKWGLLAPPNDVVKRAKVVAWMKLRQDIVSKAKDELRLQQLYP